ncbi:extensin family protein [Scandinavium sp. M-37]|uniref:extensin-like domain-containing protein n=1 Tax=Scandinavium sp. M-37 TaxID=3373077 RepID=UPI0037452B00
MRGKGVIGLLVMVAVGYLGYRFLPPQFNPFAPLTLDDPPGRITQFKLKRLPAERCPILLEQANQRGWISTKNLANNSDGPCPLHHAVSVANFGDVRLSQRFVASCPLALSSALFVQQQAKPLARQYLGSGLRQIDHLGSFACRNIYHRQNARLSEHATADALDISGFRLTDGRNITVLKGWKTAESEPFLRALLAASCQYYGNGLGPDYNAAHANHFHLGMRGYGLCR